MSVEEAGQRGMEDLNDLGGHYLSVMNFIILNREGIHGGFSNVAGRTYTYLTAEMNKPRIIPRTVVPTKMRWG